MHGQKSKKPITAAESIAKCLLFRLPPELRNTIYAYVVAVRGKYPDHYYENSDGHGNETIRRWRCPITITTEGGVPEPPLLATCKTIRAEAIGIFYETYFVEVNTDSFDSTPLVLWKRKHDSLVKQYGLKVEVTYYSSLLGGRDRKNLGVARRVVLRVDG